MYKVAQQSDSRRVVQDSTVWLRGSHDLVFIAQSCPGILETVARMVSGYQTMCQHKEGRAVRKRGDSPQLDFSRPWHLVSLQKAANLEFRYASWSISRYLRALEGGFGQGKEVSKQPNSGLASGECYHERRLLD